MQEDLLGVPPSSAPMLPLDVAGDLPQQQTQQHLLPAGLAQASEPRGHPEDEIARLQEIRDLMAEMDMNYSSLEIDSSLGGSTGGGDFDSTDSASLSAEIDAALAKVDSANDGVHLGLGKSTSKQTKDLELRLELKPEDAIIGHEVDHAALEVQLEHQKWAHQRVLEKERKSANEALASLKQEMDRKLLTHFDTAKDLQAVKASLGELNLSGEGGNFGESVFRDFPLTNG